MEDGHDLGNGVEGGGDVGPLAEKDPETGGYYKPTEYQLWSLGVDEISEDEYGEGDDIYHWKQR